MGATVCNSDTFSIKIGYGEIGGEIIWSSTGCPTYLIVLPGHYKPITKNFYFVYNPQVWDATKSYYICDTSGFNSCDGDPNNPSAETDRYQVTSYEEFPCAN